MLHEQRTNLALGKLIAAAQEVAGDLGPFEAANVRDAKRNYDRVSPARSRREGRRTDLDAKVTLIPKELAKRDAELGSRGYHTWAKTQTMMNWQRKSTLIPSPSPQRRSTSLVLSSSRPPPAHYALRICDHCARAQERGGRRLNSGRYPRRGRARQKL